MTMLRNGFFLDFAVADFLTLRVVEPIVATLLAVCWRFRRTSIRMERRSKRCGAAEK